MNTKSLRCFSLIINAVIASTIMRSAYAVEAGGVIEKIFPVGFYGEVSMDLTKNFSLNRDQSGLFLSYAYQSREDYVLGVAGPEATRDTRQKMNAQCVGALIKNDIAKFTEVFWPPEYISVPKPKPEYMKRSFESIRALFSECKDALVVAQVDDPGHCHFVVRPVGAKTDQPIVIGYQEFSPGKWRFWHQCDSSRLASMFVSPLTGPPSELSGSVEDWQKAYIKLPLPKNSDTSPASHILMRVQRVNVAETGKAVNSVYNEFRATMEAFSKDIQKSPTQAWERIGTTLTPLQFNSVREYYDKLTAQGFTAEDWKGAILTPLDLPGMDDKEVDRFVVDCNSMAYLLRMSRSIPEVNCSSYLKGTDGKYRLCGIGNMQDFPGLFKEKEFCDKLREKLLLIP